MDTMEEKFKVFLKALEFENIDSFVQLPVVDIKKTGEAFTQKVKHEIKRREDVILYMEKSLEETLESLTSAQTVKEFAEKLPPEEKSS